MKRAGKIVMIIGAVGYVIFSLLWMIMILMTLFRGDASIYYDATYGYFALIFKFVRAAFYLGTAVLTFILFAKKEQPCLQDVHLCLCLRPLCDGRNLLGS